MLDHYLYLIINLVSVLFPFAYSWDKRVSYSSKFPHLFAGIFIMMLIFIPWDIWFTTTKVWGFNSDYLTGLNFFNLPIEEVLFFICIPFSSIFIYECVKFYVKSVLVSYKLFRLFLFNFGALLIFLAIIFNEKSYTFYNFLGCGILILINGFYFNSYLKHFFLSYLFVLIPFFIVNGLLTGTMLKSPIVWYNDNENLGIRLLTIPIEDTIYGLFMLLLAVNVYEWLSLRKRVLNKQ